MPFLKFLDKVGSGPAVLAHRGGAGTWRENTLVAFAGALMGGADGVELDVRRCADGVLVVHHDADVGERPIVELALADLPPYVPTLTDALACCAGAVVNVEVKNSPLEPGYDSDEHAAAAVPAVVGEVAASGRAPRLVVVSSFSPASLEAVRSAAPALPMGLLVHPALDAQAGMQSAAALGCAALHPHHSQVNRALVAAAHDLGLAVATWTVNAVGDLAAVVGAGVDAVITDQVADVLHGVGRG